MDMIDRADLCVCHGTEPVAVPEVLHTFVDATRVDILRVASWRTKYYVRYIVRLYETASPTSPISQAWVLFDRNRAFGFAETLRRMTMSLHGWEIT